VGDHSINWTESRGESAEDVIIKNYISKNKTAKTVSKNIIIFEGREKFAHQLTSCLLQLCHIVIYVASKCSLGILEYIIHSDLIWLLL
jgi:hypothetical protein